MSVRITLNLSEKSSVHVATYLCQDFLPFKEIFPVHICVVDGMLAYTVLERGSRASIEENHETEVVGDGAMPVPSVWRVDSLRG